MKPSEIRELTRDELMHRYEEFLRELVNLRHQQTSGQLTNPSRIREVRRIIARLLTILREKEVSSKDEVLGKR
jgi:large subunit ribosomal protein L29